MTEMGARFIADSQRADQFHQAGSRVGLPVDLISPFQGITWRCTQFASVYDCQSGVWKSNTAGLMSCKRFMPGGTLGAAGYGITGITGNWYATGSVSAGRFTGNIACTTSTGCTLNTTGGSLPPSDGYLAIANAVQLSWYVFSVPVASDC